MGITFVKCRSNNPIHPINGPGRTGKKEPAIPIRVNIKPRISKKASIVLSKKVVR